jgi:L-fuconolactonase
MAERADAHIHLFEGGYKAGSFTARPGVQIDEAALYNSLAKDHNVVAALVVCWQGWPQAAWSATNNAFLARIVRWYSWIHPVAYAEPDELTSVDQLEQWQQQGFVGLSMYMFGAAKLAALQDVPDTIWSWLVGHRWIISCNTQRQNLPVWHPILERHGELRILLSHLALPPRMNRPPDSATAREGVAEQLALARYPGPCVKLSGFYAVTDPPFDYPHEAGWPYVEALLAGFGAERLVWGSDFPPSLDHLTFPQTFHHFTKMPFLSATDREKIEGGNLLRLFADQQSR